MALFDQAFKDEVRDKNDIVEVISSYVKLERRGNRYVGLCPFHGEKTPSFHVIPDLRIYHCFGCKASGDVFSFVQAREHMTFYETLVFLAKRARVPLPKEERTPEEEQAYKEKRALYDALELAARFFHAQLLSEPGKAGHDYLLRRGITAETIAKFRLGWAPGYGRLYRALKSKFGADTLQKAGLIMARRDGDGYMDAFFDRVMFPITDLTGRTIGFGGRILEGNGPKYKNTAETPLFSKRQVLFGLSHAKEAIRTKNQAIIVEGYMDVIMPYQVGIHNVVAPLGTALTAEQSQQLRRQAEQVIVAFDSDTAGQMATLRGLDILYETGCDVRILRLPDGKDPDEYIRSHGVAGFQQCIDEAIPLVEFKIQLALGQDPHQTPETKQRAVEAVARVLADLKTDVAREEYANRVAQRLAGSTTEAARLKVAIDRQMNRNLNRPQNSGFQHNQPPSRDTRRDFVQGREQTLADLAWRAEQVLVHLLLREPALMTVIRSGLGEPPFEDPVHAEIFEAFTAQAASPGGSTVAQVLDRLGESEAGRTVTAMAAATFISADPAQEAGDCIEKIKQHRVSRRIEDLQNLMKSHTAAGQPVPEAVIREWTQIQQSLKKPVKS